MESAAGGGMKTIVEMMLELGVKDYTRSIKEAEKEGHKHIANLIDLYAKKEIEDLVDISLDPIEMKRLISRVDPGYYNYIQKLLEDLRYMEMIAYKYAIPVPKDINEAILFMDLNLDRRILIAAQRGNKEIVELLIDHVNVLIYGFTMAYAAKGGHEDIVQMMLEKGADNYDDTMAYAALGGHLNIVDWMLWLGARDHNTAMVYAAAGGHREIVRLMLSLGANSYNQTMAAAAKRGDEEIVQWMFISGARDYNSAMINAVQGGHAKIVHWMLELGATNYKEAMIYAQEEGHKDIIRLIEWYINK